MEYIRPASLAEAVQALQEFGDGAKLVAGGQSLLAMMKQRVLQPDALVSLKGIPGLTELAATPEGGLAIGAMVTHRSILTAPVVRERCPLLGATAAEVASVQVRNLGTWGGNVAHGEPGADPPGALIAAGAAVEVFGAGGLRRVPLESFFLDYMTTDLGPDEILTRILVPAQPAHSAGVYLKHAVRSGDMAICGVAARVTLDPDGRAIQDVRIGINGASLTPLRAVAAETALRGRLPDPRLIDDAAVAAQQACAPLDDAEASAEYRLEMVRVYVRRAVAQAVAAAQQAGKVA